MRLVSALAVPAFAVLALATPAFAAPVGLATDHFEQSWTSLPSGRFAADPATTSSHIAAVHTAAVHAGAVPAGALKVAFDSAADGSARRDIALDEMESAWHPAQRAALEDLRDARRAYAATAGADATASGPRFMALVQQVVDGSGRSIAHETGADTVLADSFRQATEALPDADLPGLRASEQAWTAYRDAFERFARAIDRPDAAVVVQDVLTRSRAAELDNEIAK